MDSDAAGLDPEVAELVRAARAAPLPPIDTVPLVNARDLYRDKWQRLAAPAPEMAASHPLEGAPVPCRVLRPRTANAAAPAVVALHGGGYVLGDLDSHDHLWRAIAHAAGCVVIAADYRRAPEHPFPAAAEDAIAAASFVLDHAPALELGRVAVLGDSAGGNLAAVAALALRPRLAAQALIYPATDAASPNDLYPSRRRCARLPPLDRATSRFFLEAYTPDIATRADWRASPLLAPDHAGAPPTLLITAGHDPLHDEGVAYARVLRAAGTHVDHHDLPGQVHGFIELTALLQAARDTVAVIAAWLARNLATPAPLP